MVNDMLDKLIHRTKLLIFGNLHHAKQLAKSGKFRILRLLRWSDGLAVFCYLLFASFLSVSSLFSVFHMAAAAAAAAVQVHVGCIKASTTQLLDSGLVRFPALSLSLVGEERGRVVKWGGGGRGGRRERKERGGGLVARLVAVVMDGFTGELEMEERVVGEEGVEQERCVKAVFFDLDDTLVLTHAADKVAQQAVLVSVCV